MDCQKPDYIEFGLALKIDVITQELRIINITEQKE